jgi:hypothetical protein
MFLVRFAKSYGVWIGIMRIHTLVWLCYIAAVGIGPAQLTAAALADQCGEVVTVATHDRTTTRFALTPAAPGADAKITLVLLIGGGGNLNLDDNGCPRSLSRNVLMRMLGDFHRAGFATAVVDAPSDAARGDGLAESRITPQHAADLAKVIANLRDRGTGSVWVVGHSRGTISAANAAARLTGTAAPDGVVLLSAMLSGDLRARKRLARQSVFDLPLEAIKTPLLVVGHAADNCERSPAALMENIARRSQGTRTQVATVAGGPVQPGRAPDLAACEVGEPHDFVAQEGEVAAGIVRFIRGGRY